MEPLISPLAIYFASVCGGLRVVLPVLFIFLLIALLAVLFCWEDIAREFRKYYRAEIIKKLIIFAVADLALLAFIPSKETVYAIIIANGITPDNIEAFKNGVIDVIKQIKF